MNTQTFCAGAIAFLTLSSFVGTSSAAAVKLVERDATWAPVKVVNPTIPNQDAKSLPATPSTLDQGVKAFLDHYQPNSKSAGDSVASGHLDGFPAAGLCTQEYPCLSVDRVGLANFGPQFTLAQSKMDQLLQKILAQPTVTFDQSNSNTILNGAQLTTSDLTLDVIAAPGNLDSTVLAGCVFDLLKAQGLSSDTNAVRGVTASDHSGQFPPVGLCVYPSGADQSAANSFCQGKELDGSQTPAPATQNTKTKRFSLDGIIGGFCSVVDLPLVCPSKSSSG